MTVYSGLNSSTSYGVFQGQKKSTDVLPIQQKQRIPKTLKCLKKYGSSSGQLQPPSQRSDDDNGVERTDFFVWGSDKHGQLGQNTGKKQFTVPRGCVFQGIQSVRKVSCGDSHSMILTSDGLLYAFGSNQGEKLGLKDLS